MPCYTSPKSYELVVPSGNNCQPPQNKLRTESINSGNIRSIYDTTLLTGTNKITNDSKPIWVSPKVGDGTITNERLVVNEDGTFVSSSDFSNSTLRIFDSSSSDGNDSFTPDPPQLASTLTGALAIVSYSSTGKVMKVAGIGISGGPQEIVNLFLIKHSDGGYYVIVSGVGNPTIFKAGQPDGSGNVPPPISYNEIDMNGNNFILIVKYSSELEAEWCNAITCEDDNMTIPDYTVDESGNLILITTSTSTDQSYNFPDRFLPDGPVGPPINISSITISSGYVIAKFSNEGVLQWITEAVVNGDLNSSRCKAFGIVNDTDNNIIVTFGVNIQAGQNNMRFYDAGGSPDYQPASLARMNNTNSAVVLYWNVVVKYDPVGKFVWCNRNDIKQAPSSNMGIIPDAENSVYFNYDVITPSGSKSHFIFTSFTRTSIIGGYFDIPVLIGTVPTFAFFDEGSNYQTIIKYNSSGDFQWLSVVGGDENHDLNFLNRPILLNSGDFMIFRPLMNDAEVKVSKPSRAPTTPGDPFTLEVDITIEPVSGTKGSIIVRRNSDGDNIWVSIYDIQPYMITEDHDNNVYFGGFFESDNPARIFNAGTAQKPMTIAGAIPPNSFSQRRGVVVAMTSEGSVRWISIIDSGEIDTPVTIDTTASSIIISVLDTRGGYPVSFSNRIEPLGDGEFPPIDSAGAILLEGAGSYLISIGTASAKIVHPSYNLMYPNNNNKTIVNTTTSDAVIYGRGLLINQGVRVYEAVLGPGAVISLASHMDGMYSGSWIVVGKYGDIKFA